MKNRATVLMASLMILGLASCSDEVGFRPDVSEGPDGPEMVTIAPEGAQTDLAGGSRRAKPNIPGNEQVSARITRSQGGVLEVGRYRLVVPKNALYADTTITMITREEGGLVGCELLPHGLVFQKPVQLTMDLNATNVGRNQKITIYWFDQSLFRWIDMRGRFDPKTLRVTADLPHFSVYRSGRGGW